MWEDTFLGFTEEGYQRLLNSVVRQEYKTIPYGEECTEAHALWRHDVDFSVEQGFKLAQFEADRGIRATYFFMLNSEFYSLFEKRTLDIAKSMIAAGHYPGMHFDMEFHASEINSKDDLVEKLLWNKGILEDLLEMPIEVFSFHNPDVGDALQYDDNVIAGMVNTYGRNLRDNYRYMSDSNGVWRHKNIFEEIESGKYQHLHVLTHPGWWLKDAMPPRSRVEHHLNDRRNGILLRYDELLEKNNRPNVR